MMIEKAKAFATKAHEGQVRKYTGEPYISHPLAVADIVASVTDDEEMICAAILHDTVEDCDVSTTDIYRDFGPAVSGMVRDLTDVSTPSDGNRRMRKFLDAVNTAWACPDAKTIKLADLIHNTSSITKYDPDFAKVYMAEKKLLLEVLKEGDATLYAKAKSLVDEYYQEIA